MSFETEVEHELRERLEVKILGRVLGTASGWDGDPGELFWFYDFTPVSGIKLPNLECLYLDILNGHIGTQDDGGEFITGETYDIIEFLGKVQRT